MLTPPSQLAPPLRREAESIGPAEGLIDCGGDGRCGPNCIAFQLELLGLHQGGGSTCRTAVVDHAEQLARSNAIVIDASNGEQSLHMQEFLLGSLLTSPAFEDIAVDSLSHDTWLALMRKPSVYADQAFMAIAADCYQVEVRYTAIGLASDPQLRSSDSFKPLNGVQPRACIQLVNWANKHFVAKVAVRDTSHVATSQSQDVPSVPHGESAMVDAEHHTIHPPPERNEPQLEMPTSHAVVVSEIVEHRADMPKTTKASINPHFNTTPRAVDEVETNEHLADLAKAIEASMQPSLNVTEEERVQAAMAASTRNSTPQRMGRKEYKAAKWQARMNSVLAAGDEAVAQMRRATKAREQAQPEQAPPVASVANGRSECDPLATQPSQFQMASAQQAPPKEPKRVRFAPSTFEEDRPCTANEIEKVEATQPVASACIMYVGWSKQREAACCILVQLARSRQWCTPGGMVEPNEDIIMTALRETYEEVFSLEGEAARDKATALWPLLNPSNWFGPFGSPAPHSAFVLTDLLGDIDSIVSSFTCNAEMSAIAAVPLSLVNGTDTSFSVSGDTLALRNKLGYMRYNFASNSIAAALQQRYEMIGNSTMQDKMLNTSGKVVEVVTVLLSLIPHQDAERQWVFERRPADKYLGGLLGAFGGKVETGETHVQAALREAREEAAVVLVATSFSFVCTTRVGPYCVHTYLARWSGKAPTGNEGQEVLWLTAQQICSKGSASFTPPTWQALQTVFANHFTWPIPSVEAATAAPPGVWVPSSSSIQARANAAKVRMAESTTAALRPSSYSESPWLAPGLGQALKSSRAQRMSLQEHATQAQACRVSDDNIHLAPRCGHCKWVIAADSPPITGDVEGMRRAMCSHCSQMFSHPGPFCMCSEQQRRQGRIKPTVEKYKFDAAARRQGTARALDGDEITLSWGASRGFPPGLPGQDAWRPMQEQTVDFVGPLFEHEFRLPLGEHFEWPPLTHYAFHEDKGHLREAWCAIGVVSCSVADRPTMIPPSKGCYHFIAQVYDFVQAVAAAGLTIVKQTNHIECGPATWSSWKTWPEKILDGRMMEAGEELVWINSIGDASLGEQPHTAHEHTVGPPTQIINANEHNGANKTWCVWARHIDDIPPSDIVPAHLRHEELSHVSGTKEERMLQRSGTEPQMARAIVAAMHASQVDVPEAGRAANVPCAMYHEYRRAFKHNFGILAAAYAPTLSQDILGVASRVQACAIIMPLAPTAVGPVVMVPLQGGEVFGVQLDDARSYKDQTEAACRFLSIGIETQYMHGIKDSRDFVVSVPWDVTPAVYVTSPQQLLAARNAHQPAVWATADAVAGSMAYVPALYAVQRVIAMQGTVMHDDLNVGVWQKAKPAIMRQRAAEFKTAPNEDGAHSRFQDFLSQERQRADIMRNDLVKADRGDNLLIRVCNDVRTAADYESELPVPPQSLPAYDDPALLFILVPEPPLPLIKEWLHTLPPQAVPPGFRPLPWSDVMRTWARRMTCDFRNQNMAYDAHCLAHGAPPPSMRRAEDMVFGRGAAKHIQHADGIGSWNAFDVLLEVRHDGLLDVLDFTKVEPRPWVFEAIAEYIGSDSNQEILSFIFHGVRWKLEAPRQVRLCHNLARLNAIVPAVNEALFELERLQYIEIRWVCKVQDKFTIDGPCPFNYIPGWDVGIGGLLKANGKARCVGNMTAPLDAVERNAPEGPPDGPAVITFNDLSGPKGGAKEGYTGPLPFPDPEIKPRPRHKYAALVLLRFYANLNNTFVVMAWDDMWQMFFQFKIAIEDRPWCNWNTVAKRNGVTHQICIKVGTMNQGGRNSSKIACEMANPWLAAWASQMDAFVKGWLPLQQAAFQDAYRQRRQKLGLVQARPFWCGVYTDNFEFDFMASDLAAEGFRIWLVMNKRANIRLQEHVGYGTCTDWIGGRCVAMGGFGCLVPSKRQRAITHSRLAIDGRLSRELYEKHISFLVHASDICDWPHGLLKGLAGPLRKPGQPEHMVELTPAARTNLEEILAFMSSRPLASFYSGIDDALLCWDGTGQSLLPIRAHATDTCTDPAPFDGNPHPKPHIAGMVDGMYWRFELKGEWLDRHITLTEGAGPAIESLVAVPMFPTDINVLGGDATAAVAATVGAAQSLDMLALTKTLREEPVWQRVANTIWATHWKGWGNGITDALSRDNIPLAVRLAAAFGIKLHEIPLTPDAHRFMWRLRVRTRPMPNDKFQIDLKGFDGKSLMIYTHDSMTAAEVIEVYEVEVIWERASLRLVFKGKQLLDTDTMEQAGVKAHDTVHVLGRLIGGSPPSLSGEHADAEMLILYERALATIQCGDTNMEQDRILCQLAGAFGHKLKPATYRAMRAAFQCIAHPVFMENSYGKEPWLATGAKKTAFGIWYNRLAAIELKTLRHDEMLSQLVFDDLEGHGAGPSTSPHAAYECPACLSSLVCCGLCGLPLAAAANDGSAVCDNAQCTQTPRFTGPLCNCQASPAAELNVLSAATELFLAAHAQAGPNLVYIGEQDTDPIDPTAELQLSELAGLQDSLLLVSDIPSFGIFVTALSGKTVAVDVRSTDLVSFISEEYKKRDGKATSAGIRLQWRGKMLDNAASIGSVGIEPNDHVQVLSHLNGGGKMRGLSRSPSPLRIGEAPSVSPVPVGHLAHIDEDPIPSPIVTVTQPRPATLALTLRDIPEVAESTVAAPGPPQPMTAAAARRAATRRVADALVAKDSVFSIMPGDPQGLRALVSQVGAARDSGIPKGTAKADEWGFNWAVKFGQHTNTRWMRPLIGSPDIDEELEAWYEAVKLFWMHQHMQPSKRRQARGYTKPMPSSALLATYAHRRVMRDCGRFVGDLELARDVLKGICEIYKTIFGQDAFLPQQAEIFSQQMLLTVERFLADGLVPTWTEALHIVWRALHAYLISTGTRKDEWTKEAPTEDCISRSNFVWVDDELNPLPMTPDVIGSRRKGHLLRGTSGPSKCDRLNVEWGNQKQWFVYDAASFLNFAYAFQQYELLFPCPPDCRMQWPAFSPTGGDGSFTPGLAANTHRELCTLALGSAMASVLTIHSYRATLASKHAAARANGATYVTHAVTQAHTRHKTLEALLTYEKTQPRVFADTIELSNRTDAGPLRRSDAAEIEPAAILHNVMEDMRNMSAGPSAGPRTVPSTNAAAGPNSTESADTPSDETTSVAPTAHWIDVVGCDAPVEVKGQDSWGMVGQSVHLPETTWDSDADADAFTECRITHFLGLHRFAKGGKQLAYTVTYEGGDEQYAVRADLISRFASPQQKAALRKRGPPRAIAPSTPPPPSAPPSPPSPSRQESSFSTWAVGPELQAEALRLDDGRAWSIESAIASFLVRHRLFLDSHTSAADEGFWAKIDATFHRARVSLPDFGPDAREAQRLRSPLAEPPCPFAQDGRHVATRCEYCNFVQQASTGDAYCTHCNIIFLHPGPYCFCEVEVRRQADSTPLAASQAFDDAYVDTACQLYRAARREWREGSTQTATRKSWTTIGPLQTSANHWLVTARPATLSPSEWPVLTHIDADLEATSSGFQQRPPTKADEPKDDPTCGCCRFRHSPCVNDVLQANGNCQLCNESYRDGCNCPCEGCNPEVSTEAGGWDTCQPTDEPCADDCICVECLSNNSVWFSTPDLQHVCNMCAEAAGLPHTSTCRCTCAGCHPDEMDNSVTCGCLCIYCHEANPTNSMLQDMGVIAPTDHTPLPPPGPPPPSPPPSPRGGDTFGTTRRGKVPSWGKSDKASRERARKATWDKKRRAFERRAFAERHPQECPVCMDRQKTHLLYSCALFVQPYHRGHGLCGECAHAILRTTATCPLCNLPIEGALDVGTAAFV